MDIGAAVSLVFVGLVILLSLYTFLHSKKRRAFLNQYFLKRGFQVLDSKCKEVTVPDNLFYPNSFNLSGSGAKASIVNYMSFINIAWKGALGKYKVVVFDVHLRRNMVMESNERKYTNYSSNQTVICCSDIARGLPNLLIQEYVFFKGQVDFAVVVDGRPTIGKHYILSSSNATLASNVVNNRLRHLLSKYRLWKIAIHEETLYLSRGNSVVQSSQIDSFLTEGHELVDVLMSI